MRIENGVSVLIPFQNFNQQIIKCVQSINYNSEINIEILCVYDDKNITMENYFYKELLKIKNVKLLLCPEKGLVQSLNFGLSSASFSYVARVDSDDIVIEKRFEKQKKFLDNNLDCAVVGGQVVYIDENDNFLGVSKYPVNTLGGLINLQEGCFIAHPSVMFRKEVINKVGGYRKLLLEEEISYAEDYDLWFRVQRDFRIVNLPDFLIKYRIHSGQSSKINSFGISLLSLTLRYQDIVDDKFFLENISNLKELKVKFDKYKWSQKFNKLINPKIQFLFMVDLLFFYYRYNKKLFLSILFKCLNIRILFKFLKVLYTILLTPANHNEL